MFSGRSPDYDPAIINNTGFWAEISVAEFQEQRAIPLQIPAELCKSALIAAMHSVEIDLQDLSADYQAKGIAKAADIAAPLINGENCSVSLYKKAVFARAKADLLPEFATLAAREVHQAREYVTEQKSLLAEAVQAIRTLKGKQRGTVWLI